MYSIIFSDDANNDISNIKNYIARDNPQKAQEVI